MISELQISAMLDYGKIVLEEFAKELKLMKVVAICRYVRKGILAVTKAFTTVNDHRPVVI